MSKVADYLRTHVVGEVVDNMQVRESFSTDGSIFSVTPQIIVYPRTIDDVRKITRFSWQLAERKKAIPITARGAGTDLSGGAIGEGIILSFPAHMNKLLELDTKKNYAQVQPGINYRNFQDTLKTHGRFLPPFPSSIDYVTVGGAIANNSVGAHTVKYGTTQDFVTSLNVVLANGELIETGRVNKRELNRKKGLSTFEGEIYRQLDGLISDNTDLIYSTERNVSSNTAGYALSSVKQRDGSFDLTPLLVGSQGTLGIITQAQVQVAPNNMERTLIVAGLSSLDDLMTVLPSIAKLEPSAFETVDKSLLQFIEAQYPNQLNGIVEQPYPEILCLIEFDDLGRGTQGKKAKKTAKILKKVTEDYQVTDDYDERDELWKIRESAALVALHTDGNKRAVPIINDGIVPLENLQEFIIGIRTLLEKHSFDPMIWGSVGSGNLCVQPMIDLSKVGERQKVYKLMDEYYELVIRLNGTTSAGHNDGRLRATYLGELYGEEIVKLLEATKKIFDPHNILNPGVKLDVDRATQLKQLRSDYNMAVSEQYLPMS